MKLSQLTKLIRLSQHRRELANLLEAAQVGEEIEANVGGWPVDVPEAIAEALHEAVEADARAELDKVEAEIRALGVEIDVEREAYLGSRWGAYHPGEDVEADDDLDDDDDESAAAEQAEPAEA